MALIVGTTGKDSLVGGAGADELQGLGNADTLIGGDGNDTLDGGAGADSLDGGLGDDLYIVDSLSDVIAKDAGGIDTIRTSLSIELNNSFSLFSANKSATVIENVELTGTANRTVVGNNLGNVLTGNDGRNVLDGGAGADTLIGGLGNDTLTGGLGVDRFVWRLEDMAAGGFDRITDFEGAGSPGGDVIDVSGVAAAAGAPAGGFVFGGGQALAYGVWAVAAGSDSRLHFDLTGDGVSDFSILAEGVSASSWTAKDMAGIATSAPIAVNDSYGVAEDGKLVVSVLDGLRANDSDPDGDKLAYELASGPANGTVTIGTNGNFTYRPNADYNGVDSFTYKVSDGNGGFAEAKVTVTVTPVNDAPIAVADSYTVEEDGKLVVTVADGLRANDSDPDGDKLTYELASGPAHGTVTIGTNGNFTYRPDADYNGVDSFTYKVSDGNGGFAEGKATVTVTPVNDAPIAVADSYTVEEDGKLVVTVADGLRANDSDPDGDKLTYELASGPAHGTVTIGTNGNFTYRPNADYNGVDSFTYKVSDGNGGFAEGKATVTVTPVNDAPIAVADSYTVEEDGKLVVTAADGLRANDSDPDGDKLTYELASGPAHGTVTIGIGGNFTYRPDADYNGVDSFTYKVSDGNGGFAEGKATVTVTPVNDAPIAVADSYTVEEDGKLVVTAADGLRANDSDPDGDKLTYELASGPAHGTVTIGVGGNFTYRPDADYNGVDSFTYKVSDGNGGFAEGKATVTVTPVNDAPVAVNDTATTNEDAAVVIDVLSNDSDVDGDSLSIVEASASKGSVSIAGGKLSFDPGNAFQSLGVGQSETVSLTYKISDGQGGSDTASVTVTVTGLNDAPVAVNDTATTNEDAAVVIDVLSNDSDVDGDNLSIVEASASKGEVTISGGKLTFDPDGAFESLGTGDSETVSITYKISDGQGGSDTASVTVTVTGVNDAPVAVNDKAATNEDTPVVIDVLSNDSDVDGDSLSIVEASAGKGSVSIVGGKLSFDPGSAFQSLGTGDSETVSLTYKISDGQGGSDTASVTVTVTGLNDAPVAVNDKAATNEDTPVLIDVLSNDSDVDGDSLSIVEASASKGSVSVMSGKLVFDPGSAFQSLGLGQSETVSLTYKISDGQGGSDTASVTVTVTGLNDAPVAVNDKATTNEDTPVVIDVLSNDSDVDGDSLSIVEATASKGEVTISGGKLTFDPDGAFESLGTGDSETVSITYKISDGLGGSDTASVTVTVTGVNDAPLAVNDTATTNEDTPVVIDVLSNDSDVDGDSLSIVEATASKGEVTISGGKLTFDPDGAFESLGTGDSETVSIAYKISDGKGGSDTASVTVTVTGVNDAPVLTGLATSVTFAENTVNYEPQLLDGEVTLSDVDSADFKGGTLTVSGLLGEDRVSIRNVGEGKGEIGVDGSDVTYGGVVVGTASGGEGSSLVVTFNEDATAQVVEAVIENLTYANSSDDPTASRDLSITVTDGDGGSSGANSITVQVTPEPDDLTAEVDDGTLLLGGFPDQAVVVDLSSDTVTEGGSAVTVSGDAIGTAVDIDASAVTASGSVSLTGDAGANRIVGSQGDDSIAGGGGADTLDGGGGNDTVDGGSGSDVLELEGAFTDYTVTYDDGALVFTKDGASLRVSGVESVSFDGVTARLVGAGSENGIQDAIDAADEGDIVLVAEGTYEESVTLDKEGVTLTGVGEVVIKGSLREDNSIPEGTTVGDWLEGRAGYNASAGTGIAVSADGVTLSNITVTGFFQGLSLQSNDGLTVQGVVFDENVIGVYKLDGAATVTNFQMLGGAITNGYQGFLVNAAIGAGGFDQVTIDGTTFEHLTWKGIYLEQVSNAQLINLVMTDVGQYGRAQFSGGTVGGDGTGIEINAKYGDYENVTISDFTLTDVGLSNGGGSPHANGSAIAIKARDDAPSYSGNPATLDNVTIENGTIDGTSTGIRVGEAGKSNATPTNLTIDNVEITDAVQSGAHGDLDNVSQAVVTVQLADGGQSVTVREGATGDFLFKGGSGDDQVSGGGGDDVLQDIAGSDTFDGGGGLDTVQFAGDLADADITANADGSFTIVTAEGEVTVAGVEYLQFEDTRAVLVDEDGSGFTTLQQAEDNAVAGDVIIVGGGSYAGFTVATSGLTLRDATGDGAVTITGASTANASAIRVQSGVTFTIEGSGQEGLVIAAGKANQTVGVNLVGNNDGSSITNATLQSNSTGGPSYALQAGGGQDGLLFEGNAFEGKGTGNYQLVYVNGNVSNPTASSDVSFIDNSFEGDVGGGVLLGTEASGGTISGNSFSGSSSYAALEVWNGGTAIEDNEFGFVTNGKHFVDSGSDYDNADIIADNSFPGGYALFEGEDAIRSIGDTTAGGAGDDTIVGDGGGETMQGGAGNDLLMGGKGADLLLGDGDPLTLFKSYATDFDEFTLGTWVGQQGWSGNGTSGLSGGSVSKIDGAIIDLGDGDQAFRISNAATSGNYGFTWPFLPEVAKAGEALGSAADTFSFSFDFKSAVATLQEGLQLDVTVVDSQSSSARHGVLRITDSAESGLKIQWAQALDNGSGGYTFEYVTLGENLDRSALHSVDVTMVFKPGALNDEVTITLDDQVTTGLTSWERYFETAGGVEPPLAGASSIGFRNGSSPVAALENGGLVFDNVEVVSYDSTQLSDTLQGGNGNDTLDGGLGDDLLQGGVGQDLLAGGQGNDTLSGEGGTDVFVFDGSGLFGHDVITDFADGLETIRIESLASNFDVAYASSGADAVVQILDTAAGGAVVSSITVTGLAGLIDQNDLLFV